MNLGQVVVGQQKMHLVGKIQHQLRRPVERDPAILPTLVVEVVPMNQLVKDQVTLRVAPQVRHELKLAPVGPVIVQVPRHHHVAGVGKRHDLSLAPRVEQNLLFGGFKRLDGLLGADVQ